MDINKLPVKVLQIGEGNFLRSFADWIIDQMNKLGIFNGRIVIVQPIPEGKVDILNLQNGKYNIFLRGINDGIPESRKYHIDSVAKGVDPFKDYDSLLKEIENPDLRFIISNTTEAGIADNIEDRIDFRPPVSFPGKLTALLYHRWKIFKGDTSKGFIIFPCELIDNNGTKLQELIIRFSRRWKLNEDFISWVQINNYFCNTLVDRIVTGYPNERIDEVNKELGYDDLLVADCELFHLWVIEAQQWIQNEFPAGEAGLNVIFVKDIAPYRDRKVRILNGSHTIMTPVSYLAGNDTVNETINDPLIGRFIRNAIYEEIIPNIEMPEAELTEFAESTITRFKNPYIKHKLLSISLNSISKFTARVLPTLLKHYKTKHSLPERITFSLSCLLLFYKGKRGNIKFELKDSEFVLSFFYDGWNNIEKGNISLNDLIVQTLKRKDFWNQDLSVINGLAEEIEKNIVNIKEKGISECIKSLA